MKKINVVLAFILVVLIAQCVSAQDTNSSQPPAPSSQSTTPSSSKNASNDGDLTQQLQLRLGQDPAFANVQVSVSNGTAMITGSVPAKADKKRAKEMAKSIAGVRHVKEQLTVNPSSGNSTNSSKNNNPANASIGSGSGDTSTATSGSVAVSSSTAPASTNSDQSAAATGPKSANPPNAQASATSSQASSTTGAPTASSAAAASPATGDNASSVPQNAGNAANENNMAGQEPASAQSGNRTSTSTGAVAGGTSAPSSATQPAVSAGAIGANAGGGASTTSSNPTGDEGVSVNDTATLQNQIQNALQNEPTLRNDNLNVAVTDSTIQLSGNVQNSKEKQTARRIASSFAGNRRVQDRVTLSGKGSPANSSNPGSLDANPTGNNQKLDSNPNAQNPSANNPKANGDASANPR